MAVAWSSEAPMHLLEPWRVLGDEGLLGGMRIALNVLTKPVLRHRILAMRRLFRKYGKHLGATHDVQQWSLGLLRVAEDFADIRITNEGTKDEFYMRIDALLRGREIVGIAGISTRVQPRHAIDENQLFRCLASLDDAGRPLSCDEIQENTGDSGSPVRHNNANKVLKRVPELARRLELEGTRVRYEITNAGRAYLRYMRSKPIQPSRSSTLVNGGRIKSR